MFSGKGLTLFSFNISSSLEIALVANEHDDHVTVAVLPGVLQPGGQVVKGVSASDIIHQQSSGCTTVIGAGDGAECLLPSRVPDLKRDRLLINRDFFIAEVSTNRWFTLP